MAPRRVGSSSSQAGRASFAPPAETSSYKDLLLFEERLKQNAALLRSRKRKYEIFLAILLASIAVLTHKSFLRPSPTPSLHYLHLCLLPVGIVTLLLFFASGMYAERIGYANRYVPHANRALRSLNMHLNMRVQPTPLIPFAPWPISLLLPSSTPSPPPPNPANTAPATTKPKTSSPLGTTGTKAPIPAIPPTKNPRGELIFSSRVDRTFREGYERYRGLFERRREERYRDARASKPGLVGHWWRLLGYRKTDPSTAPSSSASSHLRPRVSRDITPTSSSKPSRTPSPSGLGEEAFSSSNVSNTGSVRRRRPPLGERASTPSSSTAHVGTASLNGSAIPEAVELDVVAEKLRAAIDLGTGGDVESTGSGSGRIRAESFSFLLHTDDKT